MCASGGGDEYNALVIIGTKLAAATKEFEACLK
jgi:hypothetical protein